MKWVFGMFLIGVLVALTYFAARHDNPVNQARANEIDLQAQQQAADQELARQQQEALNQIQLQERAARSAEMRQAWATFTRWTGRALTLAAVVGLTITALSYARFASGRANAAVMQAEFQATLLPVDKQTGQFPALPIIQDGKLLGIGDPNTGQVMMFDAKDAGNAQLIAGAIAIRYAQAIARLAAETKQGSVAGDIHTPIIHPQMIDLESLQHLLEQQNRSDDNA